MSSSDEITPATIAAYEQDAVGYAQRSSDRTALAHLHRHFAEMVKPGASVLDLGSGPGHDSVELFRSGLKPTCCEPSLGLLTQARVHDELKGNLIQAEGRSLPFATESFDSVWACASLLHVAKHEIDLALREVARVLRRDGVLFTSMQEGASEGFVSDNETDQMLSRYYAYYGDAEWQAKVEAAGFGVIDQHVARVTAGLNSGATGWIETFARKQ